MDSILFLAAYLGCLFLPGLALKKLLFKNKKIDPLYVIALSYATICTGFLALKVLNFSASAGTISLFSLLTLSVMYLSLPPSSFKVNRPLTFSIDIYVISIIIASSIYQLFIGVYLEIPGDIFTHLERYQNALHHVQSNSLGDPVSMTGLLMQDSKVFYYLPSLLSSVLKINVLEIIDILDLTHRTVFLVVIYLFCKRLFLKHKNHREIAIVCCLLTALHLGINVISFIRYYSLAPVILNMGLYFGAIGFFLDSLSEKKVRDKRKTLFLTSWLILVASAIHVQEAIFAIVMIFIIAVVGTVSPRQSATSAQAYHPRFSQLAVLANLLFLAFLVIYIYSFLVLDRSPNAGNRLWEFGQTYEYLPQISTLNLKFQFAQTVTIWGALIYFLFFLNFKRYIGNFFILAGMLSPIFTILNPLFIDLFLRHEPSTTLWRLCYLIPIHFVAADLLVYYFNQIKRNTVWKKLKITVLIACLILPLFPIANKWQNLHFSRFPTLFPPKQSNTVSLYKDLLDYLASIETPSKVLTDPITGYLVSATTHHFNDRRKFFRSSTFKDFTFKDYSLQPLAKYHGYLLILNQREMPKSAVGRLSGHWDEDPWYYRKYYYTPKLREHLERHPSRFKSLWSQDGITVYKIINQQ